ncbi:ATP-dependent DNA helicase RecQ [Bacillus oleivorans]|uniref:ATP-dependent DNA helicase RecQ n=1 Tax=Bacillus oleivorans TaxID=1448271 RepID=A0A285CKM9_9BACI|nr:ATP-dependent DNA helicase RecQ [Bacillus oleivorans]SNX68109.1 ATP-dependent DNA helicase RecQ [Bacillus oleivorans]
MDLEKKLKEYFGFTSFRKGQKEVIESVLNGFDTLAVLPTGTGKSLCYQLAGYIIGGPVIIVSPLLSLMQDQVESIRYRGEKRVAAYNSFLSRAEKQEFWRRIDQYRFIFFSPEMITSEYVKAELAKLSVSLLVIDEAHCISQWGYDFRPDYLQLGEVREALGHPSVLALTATATPEVQLDIKQKLLFKAKQNTFNAGVNRPNLLFAVENVSSIQEKFEYILSLADRLPKPGIIYFSSKRLAEEVCAWLKGNGHEKTSFYHADVESDDRILIQQQFLDNQLDIICATSAFGMGVNKEDVRFVIHFQPPLQLESFVQEIGRAGRDGNESYCILLHAPLDEQLQLQLIDYELPAENQVYYFFECLKAGKDPKTIIQDNILNETHVRILYFLYQNIQYNDSNEAVLKIVNWLEQRRILKTEKAKSMMKFIDTNQCRREFMIRYFKEDFVTRQEVCCDNCGWSILSIPAPQPKQNNTSDLFDWKAELALMLGQREGSLMK